MLAGGQNLDLLRMFDVFLNIKRFQPMLGFLKVGNIYTYIYTLTY